jgi:hypothetical protein
MFALKNIGSTFFLPLIGGIICLVMSGAAHAQMTETEAKHEKSQKGFSDIEVLPRFGKGRWCNWIANEPGTLFDNSERRFFQSVVIYGNPQWQYSYVSGTDIHGDEFSGSEFELRRFTLGMRVHFLQHFTFTISSDMEDDSGPDEDSDYESLDYALYSSDIIFDAQDAFNWDCYDKFQIRFGYFKVPSNAGWATSSNSMRAIERAAISNYSSPSDSLGLLISALRNRWDLQLGLFSGDDINNGLTLDQGSYWLGHVGYIFGKQERMDDIRADLRVLVNNDADESETFTQNWAVSLSTEMRKKHWRLMSELIVGENGDLDEPSERGRYWGINLTPSLWIIEDRLEAVFRYQYVQAQERNGFRLSSHSARRIADDVGADINGGYGDKNHSAYAGMNYYLCGDHTKAMVGVQWDKLTSKEVQVYEGFTTWVAFRLYF